MLATISYHTFPDIGPLKTFGLMVGLGVLLGAFVAAKYAERFGVPRDDTYAMATKLVIAGVIGARLTWDLSHWDQIHSPLDLIAVWNGGLQFSGGFILAVIVGYPTFRKWSRLMRWRMLDGYAMGLTIGLAFGRIGCTSVGEHFGKVSSFFLAVRYTGGVTREDGLYLRRGHPPMTVQGIHYSANQVIPLRPGLMFHNTAIYELIFLLVLFVILRVVLGRRPPVAAGTGLGIFCLYYGLARGATDFLRVNDKLKFGLTGAQWMCVALIPIGIWILTSVRHATARLAVEEAVAEEAAVEEAAAAGANGDPAAPDVAEEDVAPEESTAEQTAAEPEPNDGEGA